MQERRHRLADDQPVLTTDVFDDLLIHRVARGLDGLADRHTAQRHDRDIDRARAHVDDHHAVGRHDISAAAERRRLSRFDQQDASDAEARDRADDRALLDLGDLTGDTRDNTRHDDTAGADLRHEDVDHLFHKTRFGDDAALEREHDVDLCRCPAEHLIGFITHGEDQFIVLIIRDDRRLVDGVLIVVDPESGVGGT